MKKRSPPAASPEALIRRWHRLVALGTLVTEEYAWVHSFAYGPSGRSIAATRAPSSPNKPTERIALDGDRAEARRALLRATSRLAQATRVHDSALRGLERSLGPFEKPTPGGGPAHRQTAARAARARREARGEGWGDG